MKRTSRLFFVRSRVGGLWQVSLAISVLMVTFAGVQAAAPPARQDAREAGAAGVLDGQEIYEEHCESCHQVDGQGVAGVFPPLTGSGWVTGDKGRLIRILLHGMKGPVVVKGETYSGRMPAWKSVLDDSEMAQVATYVRADLGNHASEVSSNEVKRVRTATQDRSALWTAEELRLPDHTGIPEAIAERANPSGKAEERPGAPSPGQGTRASEERELTSGHPYPIELPEVYRTFMPESSPASIAVGLPGGASYCFDAGVAYLRYAWQGGYVDNTEQWDGSGNAFTKIEGTVYYRNQVGFPFRFGTAEEAPSVAFKGYSLLDNGYPEFRYVAGGVRVSELVEPHPEGDGLVRTFEIGPVEGPLWFVTGGDDTGVTFEASAGVWEGDTLRLPPEEARRFTITMTRQDDTAP